MNWPIFKLSQLCSVQHGYAFKGQYFDTEGPYVLLTPGNFREEGGYRDQGEKTKFYTGDVPSKFLLDEGDLLVAMTEQAPGLLGSSVWVPASGRFLHNQRLGRVVDFDERRVDKKFLYYLFNTSAIRNQISASATGTKVRHTAPERIGQVVVSIPTLKVQARIASILSAYDDLIESNRRRIALLEEAALQLYRDWFVRLRFPGHEHTSIISGLPEGWVLRRISDLGHVITGKTPSTREADNYGGEIPFIKTPDMRGNVYVTSTDSRLTEKGASTQEGKCVYSDAILVSCIGTVGIVALASGQSHFNQQINAVVPFEKCYRYYCLFAFRALRKKLEAIGGGSTMANVSKAKFENLQVIRPPLRLLSNFDDACKPIFRQILVLSMANQKLRAALDLLLPRLISGEITV